VGSEVDETEDVGKVVSIGKVSGRESWLSDDEV